MSSAVDELPSEMRERYLLRRREDLSKCLDALGALDFTQLSKVGHQVRGNAASFGFERLAPVGEELEQAAAVGDRERSMFLLNQFEAVLNEYRPL
jgi:HPt (histidine-containing phosphotransfer) domain-containing protein